MQLVWYEFKFTQGPSLCPFSASRGYQFGGYNWSRVDALEPESRVLWDNHCRTVPLRLQFRWTCSDTFGIPPNFNFKLLYLLQYQIPLIICQSFFFLTFLTLLQIYHFPLHAVGSVLLLTPCTSLNAPQSACEGSKLGGTQTASSPLGSSSVSFWGSGEVAGVMDTCESSAGSGRRFKWQLTCLIKTRRVLSVGGQHEWRYIDACWETLQRQIFWK